MNIEKSINRLFKTCGQDVVIRKSFIDYHDKAFIQLMRYKNKIYVDLPAGEVGIRDNGTYLYIGKPKYDFTESWGGIHIFCDGYRYLVKRAQMIYLGTKPVCVWAVLYRTVKDGEYERN